MKLAKFVKYGGSTMSRLFLHHAAWEIGEIRAVNEEEAQELKRHFAGSFEISDPAPPTPPDPAKFAQFLGPKPAEPPVVDNPPAKPVKE